MARCSVATVAEGFVESAREERARTSCQLGRWERFALIARTRGVLIAEQGGAGVEQRASLCRQVN